MKNANKPATPISVSSSTHGNICSSDFEYGDGLTKREHFAGLAMQSLLAHYGTDGADECASYAVKYANALLKALEQENE
tara:strand:- start:260 stop:496 length:237 start_codon:yes stop_codon:yes gene_type:complete